MDYDKEIADLKVRVSALESARPGFAKFEANAVVTQSTIDDVEAMLKAQGLWLPAMRIEVEKALRGSVPASVIVQHYAKVVSKYENLAAANAAGHFANFRMSEDLIGKLNSDPAKWIGYTGWSATPEEQKKAHGYTQADIDAASAANPEKFITDYPLFVSSDGKKGWKPRKKDSFGNWL